MKLPPARQAQMQELWAALPSRMSMLVEQLRGTFVRRDERGRGVYRSPLPLPFHYGACPSHIAPDGSGLDVILVGGGRYALGDRIGIVPLAVADFQDGPDWDPKLIAKAAPASFELSRREIAGVWLTLTVLAGIKSSRVFAGTHAAPARLWGIHVPEAGAAKTRD